MLLIIQYIIKPKAEDMSDAIFTLDQNLQITPNLFNNLLLTSHHINFTKQKVKITTTQHVFSSSLGPFLVTLIIEGNNQGFLFVMKILCESQILRKVKVGMKNVFYLLNEWNCQNTQDKLVWRDLQKSFELRSIKNYEESKFSSFNLFVSYHSLQMSTSLVKFIENITNLELQSLPNSSSNSSLRKDAALIVDFLHYFRRNFNISKEENTQLKNSEEMRLFRKQDHSKNINFQKEIARVRQDFFQKSKKQNYLLLLFQIRSVIETLQIDYGTLFNHLIEQCKCEVAIFFSSSINKDFNEARKDKQKQGPFSLIKVMEFIKKEPLSHGESQFRNETFIVKYLRFNRCPRIASYFVEERKFSEKISQLYVEQYPYKFISVRNAIKKVQVLIQLTEGLCFLQKEKIIHRDLKPANLLLSKSSSVKIIDFGSSYFSFDCFISYPKDQIDSQLFTTKYYNFFHQQLPDPLADQIKKQEFERHPNFDVYSLGVLIGELCLNKDFEAESGVFVFQNLQYLSQKCRELHPGHRLTLPQILLFLNKLKSYLRIFFFGRRVTSNEKKFF